MSFTSAQLSSLNKINDLLADLEPRIFEKVKQFHVLQERGSGDNKLTVSMPFTGVKVTIAYYSYTHETGPFHSLTTTFHNLIPPDFVWETGEHAPFFHAWPALVNPCSYLMHNRLQQSCQKLTDIINLSLIGVQIDVAEHQYVDIHLKTNGLPQQFNNSAGMGIA